MCVPVTLRQLNAKICLKQTLMRMEAHWKTLLQEIQSRDNKVVFLESQNLVKTARHTADNLPPCWDKGLAIPDPSDNQNKLESESESDDSPATEKWEHSMSKGCEAVTMMEPGERITAVLRGPPQIDQAPNLPTATLDKDEHANLRLITETFESILNEIATAWNRAMIWIDDEVVFARLNTLLTVTKEATDRKIEAALRAEKKAANKFENVQANHTSSNLIYIGKQGPVPIVAKITHF